MSQDKVLPAYVNHAYSEQTDCSTGDLTSVTSTKSLRDETSKDIVIDGVQSKRRISSTSGEGIKTMIKSLFPFLTIMRGYSIRTDLPSDVMSGLIVGVIHIPQGMAYGMLTNLDPVYGLYTSVFPVFLYFFLGTSRHISIGTFAVVSLMIGKAVEAGCSELVPGQQANGTSWNQNDTFYSYTSDSSTAATSSGVGANDDKAAFRTCQVQVAMSVTFLVGIFQTVLGMLRFGFVTEYLPDPLTRALTMSAAVHVATTQIRHMFGVSMGRFTGPLKLVRNYSRFFMNIRSTNWAAVTICSISIVIIYTFQRWINPRIKKLLRLPAALPIELVVIVIGTLTTYLAKLDEVFKIQIVGEVPTGLPPPAFPNLWRLSGLFSDAVSIAILSFTINMSMAKLFAKKNNYELDANQEMLASGVINMVCSMLNCYASTASLSRSIVQEAAGGKTQVTGLVSCCLLLFVLLLTGPLFHDLPKCVLAAIVLVNLRGVLLQVTDIRALYRKSRYNDLMIWIVTALAVIITDVDLGLYIGIAFSLAIAHFRRQRMFSCVLDRLNNTPNPSNTVADVDNKTGDSNVKTSSSLTESNLIRVYVSTNSTDKKVIEQQNDIVQKLRVNNVAFHVKDIDVDQLAANELQFLIQVNGLCGRSLPLIFKDQLFCGDYESIQSALKERRLFELLRVDRVLCNGNDRLLDAGTSSDPNARSITKNVVCCLPPLCSSSAMTSTEDDADLYTDNVPNGDSYHAGVQTRF